MNRLEIVQQLVKLSGRYDIVVDPPNDYTDKGANYFLNAGQRYLDSLGEFSKEKATVEVPITSGQHQVSVGNFRSIEAVWVRRSDGAIYELEKLSLSELREIYGVEVGGFSSVTASALAYYATGIFRTSTPLPQRESQKVILVMPPADSSYTLLIEGLFFSAPLEEDEDSSYWSIVYPEVLIMAAQRQMEIHHRNTQGKTDFELAIKEALFGIISDHVASDGGEVNVMRPAW